MIATIVHNLFMMSIFGTLLNLVVKHFLIMLRKNQLYPVSKIVEGVRMLRGSAGEAEEVLNGSWPTPH